jgi:hypothetical protein
VLQLLLPFDILVSLYHPLLIEQVAKESVVSRVWVPDAGVGDEMALEESTIVYYPAWVPWQEQSFVLTRCMNVPRAP